MPPPPPPALPPTTPAASTPPAPPATTRGPVRTAVGLLLVLPALIGLLVGYGWPTVRTLVLSLQDRSFRLEPGEFAGLDNYRAAANRETLEAYAQAMLLVAVPALALLVVGPLLAYAAYRAGRPGRWAARLVLVVPMVCFSPAAIAMAWASERGMGEWQTRAALWLSTFGLATGLGVTLFLAVLRGRRPDGSGWPAGLAVGAVAGIAAGAVALQTFAYPILLGLDAPVSLLYRVGFLLAAFGQAAVHATALSGVLLLLGVAAAVVMIFSRFRLTIEPAESAGQPGRSAGAAVVTGLGLLAVLAVTGVGLWPWLARLGQVDVGLSPVAEVLVNTWLPPLISTVVGVGLAAVAGFGIGALRPFGRWSELLLLPFAPWLFAGLGPLVLAKYDAAANGLLGGRIDTFLGLVPTVWPVVPGLFLFTLLFRGLAEQPYQPGPPGTARYGRIVRAALPMLALVAGATWLVQSQSLLWQLVMAGPSDPTGPVLAVFLADERGLGLVLPIPAILVFAAGLAVLQLRYLDRLAIRVGRDARVRQNR